MAYQVKHLGMSHYQKKVKFYFEKMTKFYYFNTLILPQNSPDFKIMRVFASEYNGSFEITKVVN